MVSTAASKRPIVIALASLFQINYKLDKNNQMPQKPQQKVITARYHIELSECKRELDLSLEWIYKALPQPDLILWGVWEFVVSAVTHKGEKKNHNFHY